MVLGTTLNCPPQTTHNPSTPMTLDLAISLLRQGRNGSQILSILEGLSDGQRIAQECDA